MNIHQTISLKTKIGAMSIGYDNFPISQNVIPTGEHRKTCTALMLNDWIKTNYNLIVETKFEDSQMWGYILWRIDKENNNTPEPEEKMNVQAEENKPEDGKEQAFEDQEQ